MILRSAALAVLFAAPFYVQAPAQKPEPAAAALPDGREIVNRHIKEIGGREAVLSHTSLQVKGTLSVPASGISGPIEISAAANPDRVIVKTSVAGIGDIMEGFDGSHAWSLTPMTGPMLKVNKELTQAKLDADFYSELRDPKKYPSIKTVEKTTFDGRPCYKVQLQRIDGSEDYDFYDASTGLRAGSINTRETAMGTMTVTTVTGGYKKFGNLLVATAQSQKVMGVEQTITVTSVEFDKVDPAAFTPPDAIKALIK
ncbi:MAG TPA: hypothetical protein VFK57_14800 [Vicinamibacterales bacterium]|nr:hypothetical protein [Vicinamibacterales bacterium]